MKEEIYSTFWVHWIISNLIYTFNALLAKVLWFQILVQQNYCGNSLNKYTIITKKKKKEAEKENGDTVYELPSDMKTYRKFKEHCLE